MNYAPYNVFRHYIGAVLCKNLYKTPFKTVCVKHDHRLYIAIKGTSTVRDWKCNFQLKKNSDDIHAGFVEYANECYKELDTFDIVQDIYDHEHIVLSAHSLGACAAIIILYNLMEQNEFNLEEKYIELVLFGSPKPGGNDFVHKFNQRSSHFNIDVFRYNNKYDVVSTYPPFDGFNHVS